MHAIPAADSSAPDFGCPSQAALPATDLESLAPRGLSLRFGLSAAFFLIVTLTTLVVSGLAITRLTHHLREDLRTRIHDYVGTAALLIPGADHARLRSEEDESSPEYQALRRTLQAIHANGHGVRYVYTMRRTAGGEYRFVVDAEADEGEMSHIGDIYPAKDVTPDLAAAFDHPGIRVEEEPSPDDWGVWLSGFAPIYGPDGTLECILGVDVAADYIEGQEREAVIGLAILLVIMTALSVLVGYLIARRITAPLSALARSMSEVRNFQLEGADPAPSLFVEIKTIGSAFEGMRTGLRSFRRYVPAEIVRRLIHAGDEACLGAERKELSIFFSDIRDFTAIAERLPPERLSYALDRYFTLFNSLIERNGGTVDKYIGDSVMAFWGAFAVREPHPLAVCRAAMQMRHALHFFNNELEAEGLPRLETRIGINTGLVLVGNFGHADRMSYTVIGDPVNLTSRLEALNKRYGTDILVSEHTADAVGAQVLLRLVDRVAVKGRTQPTRIYTPLAMRDGATEQQRFLCTESERAFALYAGRRWPEARAAYAAILEAVPDDGPARVFLARCERLGRAEPPAGWDGATDLNEE